MSTARPPREGAVQPYIAGACFVPGCERTRATILGVCEPHWLALPAELRSRWWRAWHGDARVRSWLEVRRAALRHLASGGD